MAAECTSTPPPDGFAALGQLAAVTTALGGYWSVALTLVCVVVVNPTLCIATFVGVAECLRRRRHHFKHRYVMPGVVEGDMIVDLDDEDKWTFAPDAYASGKTER